MQNAQPLIVGAGPVGLAAALFVAREGMTPRIIDSAPHPSPYSKALAVNPRTLEILEPSGITAQMLSLGKPMRGGRFSRNGQVLGELLFKGLDHKYPFLLGLSQGVTVRLLESSLNEHGIHVEWNTALVGCRDQTESVEADIQEPDGSRQSVTCPWLFAADGAHSTVRKQLGIAFEGTSFEKPWYLVDVPLETSLADDFAHIVFLDEGGFLFLIRVIDDRPNGGQDGALWRIIGDVPDLLDRAQIGRATGAPVWSSEFKISHRINQRMQQGQIYFAGDAAHIHSPVGARGMNLGIEDAWVFAQLLKTDGLSHYGQLRRKVDRRVVRRVEFFSRLARGESATSRLLRLTALPLATRLPMTRNRVIEMVTGLDHPLAVDPALEPVAAA